MLQVVFPVPLVAGPVHVDIYTIAVGLIIVPLSLEDIAVNVPELALAACFVEPPIPLVAGTIRPDLDTIAMLHIAQPLSLIHSAVLEDHFTFILQLMLTVRINSHTLSFINVSYKIGYCTGQISSSLIETECITYFLSRTCKPSGYSCHY